VPLIIILALWGWHYYFGVYHLYTATPDQDATLTTQALRYNTGYPITYFDHPGTPLIVALANWFKFLHFFDSSISVYWAPNLGKQTQELFFSAVVVGRKFNSLCVGLSILLLIKFLDINRIKQSSKLLYYSLLTFIITSPGFILPSLIIRTEPLCILLTILSLILFKSSFKYKTGPKRFIFLFFAGLVGIFGLMAKIQALFLFIFLCLYLILDQRVNIPSRPVLYSDRISKKQLALIIFGFAIILNSIINVIVLNRLIFDLVLFLIIPALYITILTFLPINRSSTILDSSSTLIGYTFPFAFISPLNLGLHLLPIVNITSWSSRFYFNIDRNVSFFEFTTSNLLNSFTVNGWLLKACIFILLINLTLSTDNHKRLIYLTQIILILATSYIFSFRYGNAEVPYYAIFFNTFLIVSITSLIRVRNFHIKFNYALAAALLLISFIFSAEIYNTINSCGPDLHFPGCRDIFSFNEHQFYSLGNINN
jgi:hypothetical protein